MSKSQDFKEKHKRFNEALKYLVQKESELKKDPDHWQKVKKNFFEKFEEPLDAAWNELSQTEKVRLAPLYLFRKAAEDEKVKEVLKMFHGRITKVTMEKKNTLKINT